jgi:large subunit ribosomal protein L23
MSIILKPVITEKMSQQGDKFNRYGFKVEKTANKIEIKKAIEEMYNVTVTEVNTMIVPPKKKERYTKGGLSRGATNAYKKAIVTLKDGDTIDFYSNI